MISKCYLTLYTALGLLLLSTLRPEPVKTVSLPESRLKDALTNEAITKEVGIGVTEYFHEEKPHTFRSGQHERILPTPFGRSVSIGFTHYPQKTIATVITTFSEKLYYQIPHDEAVKKIRRLVQVALEVKLLTVPSVSWCNESLQGRKEPEPLKDRSLNPIRITIVYNRPATGSYPYIRERVRICQDAGNPFIKAFYEAYQSEILDFITVAIHQFPPEKIYPPELSGSYLYGRILSETDVKFIQEELAKAAKQSTTNPKGPR